MNTTTTITGVAAAAAAGLLCFVVRADLPAAVTAAAHAKPLYLCAGLALAACALLNQAALHAAAQRAAGQPVRAREVLVPVAAGGLLNAVVKSGAMAGMAPMVGNARRRNRSTSAAVAGYLLVNVLGHLAFAVALSVALVLLAADGHFTRLDAVAATVFVVFSVLQLVVIGAAVRSRVTVRRLLDAPSRLRARLRPGRRAASDSRTDSSRHADEIHDAVRLLVAHPRAALPAFGHAVLVEVIGMGELWCVLRSLGVDPGVALPVIAYGVSVLFTIVGFMPGGFGIVEAGLGAILLSFGVAPGAVEAAVILYRVLELWIPLTAGVVAARMVAAEALR